MMIKLKDSRETISAPPFCKHAGLRLLPNAPNIPNCGLVLKLTRYRVSRALEASLWKQSELLTDRVSFGLERPDPSEDRSDSPENLVFVLDF